MPPSGQSDALAASIRILGLAVGDATGRDIYPIPDMDLDGLPELLVGAPGGVTDSEA